MISKITKRESKHGFKYIKDMNKNNKGITLVALVVTIVILIILASISVSVVFGEDGLIKQAKDAAKDFKDSIAKEEGDMNLLAQEYANILATENGSQEMEESRTSWEGEVAKSFSRGTGEVGNPYVISNASELAYLAKTVNEGETYKGKLFRISGNINLQEAEWVPIGNNSNRYFDGCRTNSRRE